MAGTSQPTPDFNKIFLDFVSRKDSLHDFDGVRHSEVSHYKVNNEYVMKILDRIEELKKPTIQQLKEHEVKKIEGFARDLDSLIQASATALVSCKNIGDVPATVLARLKELTKFEPRAMCFYEVYTPYFNLDKLTNGIGSLLAVDKVPCYDYKSKQVGYYVDRAGFETADGVDLQSQLCAVLNLGVPESDKRDADGLYEKLVTYKDKPTKEQLQEYRLAKKGRLYGQLASFYGQSRFRLLVDTTAVSFNECGIGSTSDADHDIIQVCSLASDWDGAGKAECSKDDTPVTASRDDNEYERCVFGLTALTLSKKGSETIATIHQTDQDPKKLVVGQRKKDDPARPPREVEELSKYIEKAHKFPYQVEIPDEKYTKVTVTQGELLDFKRTGDALQVLSVKRLNEIEKKLLLPSLGKRKTPQIHKSASEDLDSEDSEQYPLLPSRVEETDSENSDSGDSDSEDSDGHVNPSANRVHPKKSIGVNSYDRPPKKKHKNHNSHSSFPPATSYPSNNGSDGNEENIQTPFGGMGSKPTPYHIFVTVDHLAFLKARLNGVPSIFTFADYHTRERFMYLYKPEPGNIEEFWRTQHADFKARCAGYVERYNKQNTKLGDFIDNTIGLSLNGLYLTDHASIAELRGMLQKLNDLPNLLQSIRELVLERYYSMTFDDLVGIFAAGGSRSPLPKLNSMLKYLKDAAGTINDLNEKFSLGTKSQFHNQSKFIAYVTKIPEVILRIVAGTFLTEFYNKACLYITNLTEGKIAKDYSDMESLLESKPSGTAEPDLAVIRQECMTMTCFLERYRELDETFQKGTTLTPLCEMCFDMYTKMFSEAAAPIGSFLYRNVQGTVEEANKTTGLTRFIVQSTTRTQGSTYKLLAHRIKKELIEPIFNVVKSISHTITGSLYVPDDDGTYKHEKIRELLKANLEKFDEIVGTQDGGTGPDDDTGPPPSPVGTGSPPSPVGTGPQDPAVFESQPSSDAGTGSPATSKRSTPATSLATSLATSQATTQNPLPLSSAGPSVSSTDKSPGNDKTTPVQKKVQDPPPQDPKIKQLEESLNTGVPPNGLTTRTPSSEPIIPMYIPDELSCAVLNSVITEEVYNAQELVDKVTFSELVDKVRNGDKFYKHKLIEVAQNRWTSDNEYSYFTMLTNPGLLLEINTAIMCDKFTGNTTNLLGSLTYTAEHIKQQITVPEDIDSQVTEALSKTRLTDKDSVSRLINEENKLFYSLYRDLKQRIDGKTDKAMKLAVIADFFTNNEKIKTELGDQFDAEHVDTVINDNYMEKRTKYIENLLSEMKDVYSTLFTDKEIKFLDTPPQSGPNGTSGPSGPSGPGGTSGGNPIKTKKIKWSLYDYHKKYFPLYAKIYYE